MSTNVTDVNKMLDEIAAQEQAGGKAPPPVADPNALLEAAIKPAQPMSQPAPKTVDPEKFGQVINENAQLRGELDKMRADVEALRQQATRPAEPPKPVQAADDGGWGAWSTKMVNEVDDATWLANPKEGVRVTLERGGRELATHASQIAMQQAWAIGTTLILDETFATQYPDIMATTMGQEAVKIALGKVQGDQRFQSLMRNRATRPKALAVVATIANQELGRNTEINPEVFGEQVPPRKAVYAERAGARPMTAGPALVPERQDEAMQSVIDYHSSRQGGAQ